MAQRRDRPGADIRAHIEHPGPRADIAREAGPIGALVVEPAGLLSGGERRREPEPRFHDLDFGRHVAEGGFGELRQMLELARGGVVLPEKTPRARDAPYRRLDLVLERLHAGGRDLADDEVAVTIEHEPRQQVRLAEHPAAVLRSAEFLAQDERRREPPLDERAVHRLSRVAGQDARADERVRIDAHVAEERIARSAQLRHRADIECRERRAGGVDLVAEHPQVPRGEAPIFAALQAQDARSGLDVGGRGVRHESGTDEGHGRVYNRDWRSG